MPRMKKTPMASIGVFACQEGAPPPIPQWKARGAKSSYAMPNQAVIFGT